MRPSHGTSCYAETFMHICDIFVGLGDDGFPQLLRSVSMGKLKTYQLYDRLKTRAHLAKLNSENLHKAAPRLLDRLRDTDEDLAMDLSQAILISHLDLIQAVLNFLGIPHEEGFFAKDLDASKYLTEGWEQRAYDNFKDTYPAALVHFYINHLALEMLKAENLFVPAA